MGVNKVILVGRLGKDPELRYTNQQTPVCSFSLATGERRKDASGNWTEHTEWHNIVVWQKTAENCANYLKKGREVYIEGRIQTRKWQDKEGKDRYSTEVVANTVQFLGGRGDSTQGPSAPQPEISLPSADNISPSSSAGASAAGSADEVAFEDDDIPF
ncbi:single-stranded DNA-binding protein [Oligoflexia bacterium]|nr:single-stranded DNA-binding protein [Oligoflexia bacterium]